MPGSCGVGDGFGVVGVDGVGDVDGTRACAGADVGAGVGADAGAGAGTDAGVAVTVGGDIG